MTKPATELTLSELKARASTRGVKKHVAAVHVSGTLTALQRRLANLMLLNAYDNLLRRHETHEIPVSWVMALLDWRGSKDWSSLREAVKAIRDTAVEFNVLGNDKPGKWQTMGLISFGEIEQGMLRYRYEPELAQALYNPDVYAIIYIDMQNRLGKSQYALNLYENVRKFGGTAIKRQDKVGSTGWIEVEKWRKLLGAEADTYDEFKRFTDKVLRPATKKVNSCSDIFITPEYKRDAKTKNVLEIRFRIEDNPNFVWLTPENPEVYLELVERITKLGIAPALARSLLATSALPPDECMHLVNFAENGKKVGVDAEGAWLIKMLQSGSTLSNAQKKKLVGVQTSLPLEDDEGARKRAALDAEEKRQRAAAKDWIASLSMQDLSGYAERFTQTEGGAVYKGLFDADTARFKRKDGQLAFTVFLTSIHKQQVDSDGQVA